MEATPGLPLGFTEWMPLSQAAALGLATFVQEDAPTVTAALLAAAGRLTWTAGFAGCFLGIWLGDALLYLLARAWGRPLLNSRWGRFLASPEGIARSERWFAERGAWLLVSSRFIPGTRLPTYLAAGFLRLPFLRFLGITGAAVAAWTLGIFGLAWLFGAQLQERFDRWQSQAWVLPVAVLAVVVGLRLATRLLRPDAARRWQAGWTRWTRWEFWPPWLFYTPVAVQWARLAWRHRSLTLPSAANPGIATGGLVGESKFATLEELWRTSPDFTAQAWLIPAEGAVAPSARFEMLQRLCVDQALDFPFVLKPDVGQRGVGMKVIRSFAEAQEYLAQTKAAVVAQRYAPGPFEIGVFYYRFPDEARGRVFAVTEKIFPVVVGDGTHTWEELIWRDSRARLAANRYLARFAARAKDVPAAGERLRLVEAGNHAQGCVFRDGSHLLSPELTQRLDEISQRLSGFYIGRYDLRFGSEEDLRAGRNFQILELNGASAEATSIYDARTSLRAAYGALFRQWEIVFAIGAANRARGAATTPVPVLWRTWREARRLFASYPLAD